MYLARRTAVGGLIGLLTALIIMLLISGAADDQITLAALGGPVWVSVAGMLIGGAYALLFDPRAGSQAEQMTTGMVLGILLWFVWAISLQPVLLGRGHAWAAADAVAAVPKLITYLLEGGLAGLLYGVVYRWLERPLTLAPPPFTTPAITTRVVVLGGGYAGVAAAQALEKELAKAPHVAVWLVSQNNYLIHTPMLSEVSASAVNAQNISPTLRSFFQRVQVVQGDVDRVDMAQRRVILSPDARSPQKELPFDHLVMTMGSIPNFFGNQGVAREAFTFKSLDDAILLRNQIIDMFERADVETDPAKRRRMLTFVVAGGGFAGVELLGGINDFARGICFYYPNVDPAEVRCVLVHSRDTILPELSQELGEFAREKLTERGVEFLLGVRVTGAKPGAVLMGSDELPSDTFVWTAGNQPSPILKTVGVPLTSRGQLEVNAELAVPNVAGLWAAGDCAQVPDATTGGYAPPTAQHALREGKVLGYNVAATILGKPLKPFYFKQLGSLAALGHQLAVAEVFGRRFSGFLAWLMWRGIYLSKLPTLQKQVRVLLDWVLDIFFPPDIVQTVNFSRPSAAQRLHEREKLDAELRQAEVQS
ncbi:MAG: NAD(P)/FAD-dependent oxidoreductase [Anaerolineales bacterium]|nr:NAD(P)/FAD-dependent oxidoreductase [Anaerolineales bacterium]